MFKCPQCNYKGRQRQECVSHRQIVAKSVPALMDNRQLTQLKHLYWVCLWSLLKEHQHLAAKVAAKCLANKQIAGPTPQTLHFLPCASASQTAQNKHNNLMPVHQH